MIRPRFLAGLGLHADAASRLRARIRSAALTPVIDVPGTIVAIAPGTPTLNTDSGAVIIGPLFTSGARAALTTLAPGAVSAIIGSSGEHLVRGYWGDYVAILPRGESVALVRAPFGALPCLHTADGPGRIAASDIDTLRLGLDETSGLTLDYTAIARQLIVGDLRSNATCLTGIEELRGGDRLTLAAGEMRCERLWSPWTFAAPARRIDDQREAERRLRDTARSCVALRTARASHPLLLLSGGLDSSIVAACLAAADRDFTCLNLVASNPTGDERHYARVVAARVARPLVEHEMAAGAPDVRSLAAVDLPRPVARSFEQHAYALAGMQAAALGCDALVDGGGGDNVFCSVQSASPAADCRLDPEGRRHFWRLCGDIARLAQVSRHTVAWRAFLRARRANAPSRWPLDLRFLHPHATTLAAAALAHPWLDEDRLAWPGRAAHIAMLVAAQGYAEDGPHGTKSNAISPLVSQPLIEHCLRIPSWEWFENGSNRAAARRAFETDLPAQVAWREGKGSPESLLVDLFETNRTMLRDHLGEGLLAGAQVIDRDAVIAVIDDPRPAHGTGFGRILQLADAESWARGILARRS